MTQLQVKLLSSARHPALMATVVIHLQDACLPAAACICTPCSRKPTDVSNPSINPIRVVAPRLLQCRYLHRVFPMQVTYARVGLVKEDIPVLSCRRYLCQRYMGVASLHGETKVLHVTCTGCTRGVHHVRSRCNYWLYTGGLPGVRPMYTHPYISSEYSSQAVGLFMKSILLESMPGPP